MESKYPDHMANPLSDRYLEAEVLNADPLKLVQMLYRGAIDAVAAARRHVVEKNIRERSRSITRAMEIINQLMFSLDHAVGGDLSHKLGGLYAYMQSRLLEANSQQTESPLAEVEKLLRRFSKVGAAQPSRPRPLPPRARPNQSAAPTDVRSALHRSPYFL